MSNNILAVDDEPDLLRLLSRIINDKTSYSIKTTNNSLEVPKILENEEFDLILVDLKMPGLDGMDILKMIKDQDRPEQVIMITAFGTLESAIEALSYGVFDYITKPFKKEQILFTVNRAMRFQKNEKEVKRLKGIFQAVPYENALEKFKEEYIRLLKIKYDNDIQKVAEVSGLDEETLKDE